MLGNVHSRVLGALYTDMFSCVQEPPLIASPPEVDWCGRLLGHTREETTICIKGVPGDFVVQPEHTDNEGALCQPDDLNTQTTKEHCASRMIKEHLMLTVSMNLLQLLNTQPLRLILPIHPAMCMLKRQNVKGR